jgi:hypothetical protein
LRACGHSRPEQQGGCHRVGCCYPQCRNEPLCLGVVRGVHRVGAVGGAHTVSVVGRLSGRPWRAHHSWWWCVHPRQAIVSGAGVFPQNIFTPPTHSFAGAPSSSRPAKWGFAGRMVSGHIFSRVSPGSRREQAAPLSSGGSANSARVANGRNCSRRVGSVSWWLGSAKHPDNCPEQRSRGSHQLCGR